MKSCGVIVTYIDWKKVKKWFFNIPLFTYQLTLIVFGTIYGKFKWAKASLAGRILSIAGVANGLVFIWYSIFVTHYYWLLPLCVFSIPYFVATFRSMDIGKVWQAAKASHVRLCLRLFIEDFPTWEYINFGYPKAKLDYWTMTMVAHDRFKYYPPTFEPSDEFIAAMIEYAHDQVGKRYDEYQLISNGLHLIAWIVWPWCWGKELKVIKALNRPGGREHCISGVTACLRWADNISPVYDATNGALWMAWIFNNPYYDTATTSPCLVPLSKNWREE
jgi:hypothetical protein